MKLFKRILFAFLILTAIIGFFVGDYLSRESDAFWEDHKGKASQVTAAVLPNEKVEEVVDSNIAPLKDDKDSKVLRIETISNNGKALPTLPEDNVAGAVSLADMTAFMGKQSSVHPSVTDCGIEDAHIFKFKTGEFKKRQADHFLKSIQISGSKIELKTPRLVLNKDTTLDTFTEAYADKTAVQDFIRGANAEISSEVVAEPKKKNSKPAPAKGTELLFSTSSNAATQWVLEFNSKGLLVALRMQDPSCKPK